jgi:putative membrane-bound dehydrogenase-like protein
MLNALLCALVSVIATEPPPVKVLFLGDAGHHAPALRYADLKDPMLREGITVDYTEDVDRLTSAALANYDALLVYANIDEISKDHEKAIVDFVESGHGLVPLHCASYCFRNSDAWIALVGAQFLSHGTGVFRTEITDFDHPITRGLLPFESWDETYVHTRLAADRHVLEVRVDGEHREPWTWTRTQGKGRVFYTAWGHDERTWTQAGFQELVARGIRWSAGDRFVEPRAALPKLEFEEARVPLYKVDGGHALQTTMQKALSPADSREYFGVEAGFDVKLFASEPDIRPALTMAFDERGRTWIAESVDYPNEKHAPGEGHDAIRILEDTDHDGVADHFTTFADKLSIPTSLCFARGGVIVASAPDVLFLKDTDGDGVCDTREVLFTGFGTGDTHAGPSNFRYGLDGWIWGTVGYAGFDGVVGGVHHAFGQGVYRFKPDGTALEFLASTSNNTWGLGMSEDGAWFVSTANHDVMNFLAIPNRYYEAVWGSRGHGLAFIADYEKFHPITNGVRQVDWHGQYTAAAGAALYTARLFPERFWDKIAFVCEPTGHLVHESELEPRGSGFVAHDGANLLASRDEWCAPIQAEVGPDGAVWVLDWYSFIVQHNPTPAGFETGKGNAFETPLRDKQHARIWRIVPHGTPVPRYRSLVDPGPEELVARLSDDNLLWRMHAQRLLAERGELDIEEKLYDLLEVGRSLNAGADPGSVHALWLLAQLGAFKRNCPSRIALSHMPTHPSAAMRANAMRVLPRDAFGLGVILKSDELFADPDPTARREALLALAEMPSSDEAGAQVFAILENRENALDAWIPDAAIAAGARHANGFIAAALKASHAAEHAAAPRAEAPENVLPNSACEEGDGAQPASWKVRTYSGRADHRWTKEGRDGGRCLVIESSEGADTSWFVDVPVERGRRYELSGWIRTENVTGAMGALFNVHASPEPTLTRALQGTNDWTRVSVVFDTLDRDVVSINALFGGWGHSRGKAWFDDVRLVRVPSPADLDVLSRTQARVLEAVTRHHASSCPKEAFVPLLLALRGADADLATWVLDALATAWPENTKPAIDGDATRQLRQLAAELPARARAALCVLARRCGHPELFQDGERELARALLVTASDHAVANEKRLDAASRLSKLDPSDDSVDALAAQLGADQDPEWTSSLLALLGELRSDRVARAILERWRELTPARRAEAVAAFTRRSGWSAPLLDAVEKGAVDRTEISAQAWQSLELSPDPATVTRAKALRHAQAGPSNQARANVYAQLAPAAALRGDPVRGRELFAKTCQVCHAFQGNGGSVGPALDGVGARDPKDVLQDIVDPNRSVEANYRLWTVVTKDELLVSGRLTGETKTSVEILDATGKRTTIARTDIEKIVGLPISMMPEGLIDAFPQEDVAALLAYLATRR